MCLESVGACFGLPLVALVIVAGVVMTVAFGFVQFKYFGQSWKYLFMPPQQQDNDATHISPIQAFLSALSASMGNGSIAGMATAIFSGGPGAAFWVFVFGFLSMAIRFVETFASTVFVRATPRGVRGGPMSYLGLVPGGSFLPYFYAFFCVLLSFITANAMQCNSITLGVVSMLGWGEYLVAGTLFIFVLYITMGGAKRIISFSDALAPVKVVLFFFATMAVIVYNYVEIIPALKLMVASAFSMQAVTGALAGHTMQNAIRYGIGRTVSATEAGMGTAGILFGATEGQNPAELGIMSMASAFISTQMVCFIMMLAFMVSGVWGTGLTSMALVGAAYASVFGFLGSWIATSLAVMFGLGVLVAYAFIGRESWFFLTNGRWEGLFIMLYCSMAAFGSLADVSVIWGLIDVITIGLTFSNLYGLLYLVPRLRVKWQEHVKKNAA
jgi:AGCS family alanine or glycine:cation symporter